MLAQRAAQQSLRRLAASNPSMASQMVLKRFSPLTIGKIQARPVTTEKLTSAESYKILVEQRRKRPVAPHLTIYRPQITWYLSMLNRITGVALSGTFYIFGLAYLASPVFGWHLDSASIAAAFGALPLVLKAGVKFIFALPFTFHSFNGLRHLTWDMAKAITNPAIIKSGWTVVGASVVSALALALFA